MKKIIIIIVGLAILIALAGIFKFNYLANQPGYDIDGNKEKKATDKEKPKEAKKTSPAIALIAMDGSELNKNLTQTKKIGCDDKLVIIEMEDNITSPSELLEKLFNYKDYKEEDGYYNVFSLSKNLKVDNLDITDGKAILKLSGDLFVGGMCDNPRLFEQIFETINTVTPIGGLEVYINGTELSAYLSEGSEMDH